MTTTVRSLTSPSQLDDGKTYNDLPIVFEGTVAECHNYCEKTAKYYQWHSSPEMIFGGYYVKTDNGDCLMLV
jgi:hypothetical protein